MKKRVKRLWKKLPPSSGPELAALPVLHPASLVATWFGSGLLPGAPGTWGSLAALPFGAALVLLGGPWLLFGAAVVLFIVGTWASEVYSHALGVADPGVIVVDEVVAQWMVLLVLAGASFWYYPAAFLFFRAADVLKPWPVSWVDRRVKGGLGIMLDDLFAAVYAAAALGALRWLIESG